MLSNVHHRTVKLSGVDVGEFYGAGSGMKITRGSHLNRSRVLLINVASPIIEVHLYKS
jgi:hypothetical protein